MRSHATVLSVSLKQRRVCAVPSTLTLVILLTGATSALAGPPYHVWSQRFGGASDDQGQGVSVDASGNVLVTGRFRGTVNFGGSDLTSIGSYDIFVAKYDPAGVHQWSQSFGGTLDDIGNGVAVDGSGNVLVTGAFQDTVNFGDSDLTSAGGIDIFVAKYDAAGVHQWSQRFGSTSADVGYNVAVDGSGNVLVTGFFQGTANFGGSDLTSAGGIDIFVAKYDAAGVHQWSQSFGGTLAEAGNGVAVDGSGNVLVTGAFQGTVNFGGSDLTSAGDRDIFVARYNSAGVHQWSQRFGSTLDDRGFAVALDGSGSALVTGAFEGTVNLGGSDLTSAGGRDIFVAKYNAAGVHQWSQRFGNWDDNIGYDVVVDESGNVVVTGFFAGTVNFGGSDLTGEGQDMFVAKYNSAGVHQWSQDSINANTFPVGHAVAVDGSGNVVVTGLFLGSGTVDFGGGGLVSAGGDDIFLAKFSESYVAAHESPVIDFANPATSKVEGELDSEPSASYTIRAYESAACDPSGSGPGDVLIGSTVVTTDAYGYAHWEIAASSMPAGHVLTATATDAGNVTSVFSECFPVPAVHTVTNTDDSGPGSLTQAVADANANSNASVITFDIPGSGPHTIVDADFSGYGLFHRTLVDGFSQPGSAPNTNPIDQPCNATLTVVVTAFGLSADGCVLRGVNVQGATVVLQVCTGSRVEGCFIGTDATGTTAVPGLPPGGPGVQINSPAHGNIIGGRHPGARNVISGNLRAGIDCFAPSNRIMGNFIGVDVTGAVPLGNSREGVNVLHHSNLIGGDSPAMRNVIAGNARDGSSFAQVRFYTEAAYGNQLDGNYIGVNRTATAVIPPGSGVISAVQVNDGDNNLVTDNVLGGNTWGVSVSGASVGTIVQGNFIGTDPTETVDLGSIAYGVVASNGTTVIGGTLPGDGNVITNANSAGVALQGTAIDSPILGNRIYANGGLGIDLGYPLGVTPNDAGDVDTGPNNLQNFPVLVSAVANAGQTVISGSLDTEDNQYVRLEFFSNAACDGSGHGEGATLLGSRNLNSGPTGNVLFTEAFAMQLPLGTPVTATATINDDFGTHYSTSEFSACVVVINTPAGSSVSVTPIDQTTGTSPVTLTFDNVTTSGNTTLETLATGPIPPGFFVVTDPLKYYHLTTTVSFTGNIEICVQYDEGGLVGPEANVRVIHWDTTLMPATWVDVTTSVDVNTNTVCGTTTSLSPFLVGIGSATAVGPTGLPERFALHANIPNPFNPIHGGAVRRPGGRRTRVDPDLRRGGTAGEDAPRRAAAGRAPPRGVGRAQRHGRPDGFGSLLPPHARRGIRPEPEDGPAEIARSPVYGSVLWVASQNGLLFVCLQRHNA